ncbi:MAG: DUF5931 domain-containing protein [Pseudonocardiales bacterium]
MPVATDTVTSLWQAVVVLRVVTAVFAVGSIIAAHGDFARPNLGWVVLAGIAVWTAAICLAYSYNVTRRIHVIVLDLVVTLALTASSVLVLAPEQLSEGTALLTAVWSSGPVLAAAVHAGRVAGALFGVAVWVGNVWARAFSGDPIPGDVTGVIASEAVLLVGTGFMVGLAATTARRAMEQLRRAARTEAAVERERQARSMHDTAGSDDVDLAAALRLLATDRVDVAVPAAEVLLPACDVEELVALAREVLADTARRAGPDTKALVLVEDLGAEVVLTVRDEQPGPAKEEPGPAKEEPGPADAQPGPADTQLAEANGCAGVSRSIRGRVADLGATLTLGTSPGHGTAWEVRLARATVDE